MMHTFTPALPLTSGTSRGLPLTHPGPANPREPAPRELLKVDLTVCIPNWNCRDYLHACLQSLRQATGNLRVQVVVVDNASTDGAPEMVERDFPEVDLIRNAENRGFARASNQAAHAARGTNLLFLNNDTVVAPGTLERLVGYAEQHPGVGMIGPKLVDPSGELQISYRNRPTVGALLHRLLLLRWTGLLRGAYYRYRRDDFDARATREVEVLMGAALLIRRDRFEAAGRWDEEFRFGGEDIELSVRVARQHPLIYLADVAIVHHGRISSRQNISFAAPNVTIGYVHYFRKSGVSRGSILAYKLAVMLDAPVQLAVKLLQFGVRTLRRQPRKAQKSWLVVKGLWHFLTRDLVRFWRS